MCRPSRLHSVSPCRTRKSSVMAVNLVDRRRPARRDEPHSQASYARRRDVTVRLPGGATMPNGSPRAEGGHERGRHERDHQRGAAGPAEPRRALLGGLQGVHRPGLGALPHRAARAAARDRLDRRPPRGAGRAVPGRALVIAAGGPRGALERHRLPLPAALGLRPPDRPRHGPRAGRGARARARGPRRDRLRRAAAATTRRSTSSPARRATPRSSTPTPASARCGWACGPRSTRWAR